MGFPGKQNYRIGYFWPPGWAWVFSDHEKSARVSPPNAKTQNQGCTQRRNMPTIGSITKTIRINPRDLEVIEGLMEDGTTWSGAIHKLCSGVQNEAKGVPTKNECVQRLNLYGAAYGLSGEELADRLMDAMDSGAIFYENGEFRANMEEEYDLSRLKEACHDKGVPIQKAIDNVTQMVRRA